MNSSLKHEEHEEKYAAKKRDCLDDERLALRNSMKNLRDLCVLRGELLLD